MTGSDLRNKGCPVSYSINKEFLKKVLSRNSVLTKLNLSLLLENELSLLSEQN